MPVLTRCHRKLLKSLTFQLGNNLRFSVSYFFFPSLMTNSQAILISYFLSELHKDSHLVHKPLQARPPPC